MIPLCIPGALMIPLYTLGALMGVGDVLAQTAVERKRPSELDLPRVGRFFGIGLCLVVSTSDVTGR